MGVERMAVEEALVTGAQLVEDGTGTGRHRAHTTIPGGPLP